MAYTTRQIYGGLDSGLYERGVFLQFMNHRLRGTSQVGECIEDMDSFVHIFHVEPYGVTLRYEVRKGGGGFACVLLGGDPTKMSEVERIIKQEEQRTAKTIDVI